jgi:hypothetical protein
MRCPSCNHDSPADASFCEECGAKLELICPTCKASVSLGERFCKKYGTAIGPRKAAASTTLSSTKSQIIVAADSAATEAIEGERKTVTALFVDFKRSTELMAELDPDEARAIIDPALRLMIDAVHRYACFRRCAQLEECPTPETLDNLLESVRHLQEQGAVALLPLIQTALAEGYGRIAKHGKGLSTIVVALKQIELRGSSSQKRNYIASVVNCFSRAIELTSRKRNWRFAHRSKSRGPKA